MNITPHHKIVQAALTVRMIGTSVTDESMTQELEVNHNIEKNNVRAVKSLFPGKTGPLAPLRKLVGQARKRHLSLTFEGFGDSRLLVVSEHQRYLDAMENFQRDFNRVAAEFISSYDYHLATERMAKNGSFREDDYPMREKLPEMFAFDATILPLPEPNQFLRLALGEELQQKYANQANSAIERIRRETYRNMMDLISQTAASLAGDGPIVDSENKKGPLAKLREYLERVPSLNITDDLEITRLYQAAKAQLDVSTEALRLSETVRHLTASKAANLVRQFGAVGARKIAV